MAKHDAKPIRTLLFCAGSEEKDIREGFASGAEALVIALEEPRTPISAPQREDARKLVSSIIAGLPPTGPNVLVQVQNPQTRQT